MKLDISRVEDDIAQKVDQKITEIFVESGLQEWLRNNSTPLYTFLVTLIIPMQRRQLEKEYKLHILENYLLEVESEILVSAKVIAAINSSLQSWSKIRQIRIRNIEFNLSLPSSINSFFDYVFRTSLSLISIIYLIRLISATSNSFQQQSLEPLFYLLLFIWVYWTIPSLVFNWTISEKTQRLYRTSDKDQFFINGIFIITTWFFKTLMLFWIILQLVDWLIASDSRVHFLSSIGQTFLLVTISIFSFVNILFAVIKGNTYKSNLPKKLRYEKEKIRLRFLEKRRSRLLEIIKDLEASLQIINQDIENELKKFSFAIPDIKSSDSSWKNEIFNSISSHRSTLQVIESDSQVNESLSSLEEFIDSTLISRLHSLSEFYQTALKDKNYLEASEMAEQAYRMCQEIADSLDVDSERNIYLRATALASYWKLSRDLYRVRSKI